MTSLFIGLVRCLYLIRRGRKFMWIDLILEPCLAIIAGMLMWLVTDITNAPDVLRAVLTSLGAWGGPRTIQWLEAHYMGEEGSTPLPGSSKLSNSKLGDLTPPER